MPQDLQRHVLEFVRVLSGSTSSEKLLAQPLSVEGYYKDGKIELSEPVNKRDRQIVIVTFLEEPGDESEEEAASVDAAWDELDDILKDCQISIGISDLAHQHDHYRLGTPKR